MADACDLRELLPDLVGIALTTDEIQELRLWAAKAVSRLGDSELKARLKPLALGNAGLDRNHALRGVGLEACWPRALGAEEMFASLKELEDRSDGHYRTFLREKLVARLSVDDIPVALTWAENQPEEYVRHFGKFEGLTYSILEEAAKHLADDNILGLFARTLLARLRKHEFSHGNEANRLNEIFQSNAEQRLKVVQAMLPLFEDRSRDAWCLARRGVKLVGPEDLQWLLEQLRVTTSPELQMNLCHLISWVFFPDNPGLINSVIETAQVHPILADVMKHWFAPIELDSEQAKKDRDWILQEKRWREEAERQQQPTLLAPPPADRIVSLLDKFDGGDLDAWWHLTLWMERNLGRANFDTVQVFVEVKGCWHPEVKKAMKTQLLERYLAKSGCHHGIYLVGWFLCAAWKGRHPDRKAVRFSSLEELDRFLAKQADRLSGKEAQLHAVVLDARIGSPKRRKTSHARTRGRQPH